MHLEEPELLNCPKLQLEQEEEAATALIVPAGQLMQEIA